MQEPCLGNTPVLLALAGSDVFRLGIQKTAAHCLMKHSLFSPVPCVRSQKSCKLMGLELNQLPFQIGTRQ